MNQEAIYALLAAGSYWDIRPLAENQSPIPAGWKVLPGFDKTGSGNHSSANGSGFSARVYEGPGRKFVISYAGTEFDFKSPGLYSDFVNGNIPLSVGIDASQAHDAALLYEEVERSVGAGADISFTGHSLGGGLAGLMAIWFDRPAIVFDPAPFKLSAVLGLPTGANRPIPGQLFAFVMPKVYKDLVAQHFSDPKFAAYYPDRDYETRLSKIIGYAVSGEVLEPMAGLAIEKSRLPYLVGASPDVQSTDKHSIDLLASVLISPDFERDLVALPILFQLLFDSEFYGPVPLGREPNLLLKLIRGEVGVTTEATGVQIQAPTMLLSEFTADLEKLKGSYGIAAQPAILKGLLVAAMEYYYFSDTEATAFFTNGNGGVNFDFSAIKEAQGRLKAPRLLDFAVQQYLSLDESMLVTGRLQGEVAWHVQTGSSGMNWAANGPSATRQ